MLEINLTVDSYKAIATKLGKDLQSDRYGIYFINTEDIDDCEKCRFSDPNTICINDCDILHRYYPTDDAIKEYLNIHHIDIVTRDNKLDKIAKTIRANYLKDIDNLISTLDEHQINILLKSICKTKAKQGIFKVSYKDL